MEIIDKQKLDNAIVYMQRIVDGNNPVNNIPVDENDILNNPNIIRCMYFVKEVLEDVRKNGYTVGKPPKKAPKEEFPILEAISSFVYIEDKSISKFVTQLNEYVDLNRYKKLSYLSVKKWLKENDFLKEEYSDKYRKFEDIPSTKGIELGIYSKDIVNANGIRFLVVLYGEKAQKFIVDNLEEIVKYEKDNDKIEEN